MTYQLVLKFVGKTTEEFCDSVIGLEPPIFDLLAESSADIDGHDIGANELNIFLVTDSPRETYESIKRLLKPFSSNLNVAYRDLESEDYVILYPEGLQHFDIA